MLKYFQFFLLSNFIFCVGCQQQEVQNPQYLPGCCNYVSTAFCVNDVNITRLERVSVRDFSVTSLYDEEDNFMFSVYEGEHPNIENIKMDKPISMDDLSVQRMKSGEKELLIKILDGNYPQYLHFQNFSDEYKYSVDPENKKRWIYFRTDPEYQQSPKCSFDLSVYK